TFFDEVQVYTEAGYAVVFCNPRGSSSYGQEHGRAITGRLGTVDAKDVIAFLDWVLERRADLDPGRVGVLGGSYGGYLTGWLTTEPTDGPEPSLNAASSMPSPSKAPPTSVGSPGCATSVTTGNSWRPR